MSAIHTLPERLERVERGLPYRIAPHEALVWYFDMRQTPPEWLLAPLYFALAAVEVTPTDGGSVAPVLPVN